MSIAIRGKRPPPPRRRPVKDIAAQVEPALKAADMVAKSRRRAFHPPTNTPLKPAEMVAANKRFIYKDEVLERVGATYPTIWRWMCEDKFPVAVEVGGRIAWLESDIDAWMKSRPVRQYKKAGGM